MAMLQCCWLSCHYSNMDYMDYMDLNVWCPRKAVKINHSFMSLQYIPSIIHMNIAFLFSEIG